jgi:hypothetical protein
MKSPFGQAHQKNDGGLKITEREKVADFEARQRKAARVTTLMRGRSDGEHGLSGLRPFQTDGIKLPDFVRMEI